MFDEISIAILLLIIFLIILIIIVASYFEFIQEDIAVFMARKKAK